MTEKVSHFLKKKEKRRRIIEKINKYSKEYWSMKYFYGKKKSN